MTATTRQTQETFCGYRAGFDFLHVETIIHESAFDWATVAKRLAGPLQRRRIPNTGRHDERIIVLASLALRRHGMSLRARQRSLSYTEASMNWNWVEGSLKLYRGKIKESWGRLTEDELYVINGKREQLAGRLQKNRTFDDLAQGAQSSHGGSLR